MNLIVGICCLLLLVQIEAKICHTQDDCDLVSECCMTFSPRDYRNGKCSPRLKKGRKCHPSNEYEVPNYDLYFLRCPCGVGLRCVGQMVAETKGVPEFPDAVCSDRSGE